MDDLDILKIL